MSVRKPGLGSETERFFGYADPGIWSWIPASWIRQGTVFIAKDDRFYEFTRPHQEGWWAEPVQEESVGPPARLALIRKYRLDYEIATADIAELDARVRQKDAPDEVYARLRRLEAERHSLREDLIQLCNRQVKMARDTEDTPERAKSWLLVAVAIAFLLTLVTGVTTLLNLPGEPRTTGLVMLAGSLIVLLLCAAALALLPEIRQPGSRRIKMLLDRLRPSGNLVGCLGLAVLLVIAGLAVYVGIALIWHYRQALGGG